MADAKQFLRVGKSSPWLPLALLLFVFALLSPPAAAQAVKPFLTDYYLGDSRHNSGIKYDTCGINLRGSENFTCVSCGRKCSEQEGLMCVQLVQNFTDGVVWERGCVCVKANRAHINEAGIV